MARIPVGSVHQPESEDSSRDGCREKSRGVTADTTCLRLPRIDFGVVCRFATYRFAGLKKSATKNISLQNFLSTQLDSTHAQHNLVFGQQLSRFVLNAQSWVAPVLRRIRSGFSVGLLLLSLEPRDPPNLVAQVQLLRFLHRPWVNVFVSPVDFRYASKHSLEIALQNRLAFSSQRHRPRECLPQKCQMRANKSWAASGRPVQFGVSQ